MMAKTPCWLLYVALVLLFACVYTEAGWGGNSRSRSCSIAQDGIAPGGVAVSEISTMWGGLGYTGAGKSASASYVLWSGAGLLRAPLSDFTPIPNEGVGSYRVFANVPNPFSEWTHLRYRLPERAYVAVMIYDVAGRLVRAFDIGFQTPGTHAVRWDGRDEDGQPVVPGVYLYRMRTQLGVCSGRMLVIG